MTEYYETPEYKEKLRAAEEAEKARQQGGQLHRASSVSARPFSATQRTSVPHFADCCKPQALSSMVVLPSAVPQGYGADETAQRKRSTRCKGEDGELDSGGCSGPGDNSLPFPLSLCWLHTPVVSPPWTESHSYGTGTR